MTQFKEELCLVLQSGEIREASEVRTQGSISSHLEEEEKEGGRQKRRRRRGDVFLKFIFRGVFCVHFIRLCVSLIISVCVWLVTTLDFYVCAYLCTHVDLCV